MTGHITTVVGAMGSGKTEELIRRVKDADVPCQVFKPRIDDRWDTDCIKSRNGHSLDNVILVDDALDIMRVAHTEFMIVVDECQFIDGIAEAAMYLRDKGTSLILGGLSSDFKGEAFGEMGDLLAISDDIVHIKATCKICGATATKTQRLIDGLPASRTDDIVLVGGNELYEPRCNKHWMVNE